MVGSFSCHLWLEKMWRSLALTGNFGEFIQWNSENPGEIASFISVFIKRIWCSHRKNVEINLQVWGHSNSAHALSWYFLWLKRTFSKTFYIFIFSVTGRKKSMEQISVSVCMSVWRISVFMLATQFCLHFFVRFATTFYLPSGSFAPFEWPHKVVLGDGSTTQWHRLNQPPSRFPERPSK